MSIWKQKGGIIISSLNCNLHVMWMWQSAGTRHQWGWDSDTGWIFTMWNLRKQYAVFNFSSKLGNNPMKCQY